MNKNTIKTWFPVTEANGSADIYQSNNALQWASETRYDALDRQLEVFMRDSTGSVSNTFAYGFATDHTSKLRFTDTVTDANSIQSVRFTDARGLQTQSEAAGIATTLFTYNALGELIKSIDPENDSTTYSYDLFGRVTQRTHPDAGTTTWQYDGAGNLLALQTANLAANSDFINYEYELGRLARIRYPENPEMDVFYEYGDASAGNQAGRITRQQDASGTQRFSYGKLGELIKNERTFVMPGGSETYTFEMRWVYDSWNRVLNITYPDSEVVHYDYDAGGQIKRMFGVKQQDTVPIIDFIGYDAMGSRSRIEYGNGTFTDYTYDGYRQRLSQLQTTSGTKQFMDLHYSYDLENNITGITNIASAVNSLGGVYENTYTYDDMYRLTTANGSFTDNNNTDFPFTLEMSYTASGNIATKNLDAEILSADNSVVHQIFEANYTYNQGQTHTIDTITGTNIDQSFQWDQNGNMTAHADNMRSLNRYLCWDEENRLMAVKDQNYLSAYIYDAAGERVWKLSGEVTQMKINGVGTIDVASLSNKTLYVSPYVVYNQQGYSKHYYAGAERVSSRLGGGTLYGLLDPVNDTVSPITTESGYPELSEDVWLMLERSFSDCLDLYTDYIGYEPQLESVQQSAGNNNIEYNWYIYHSDHLGSSSFLTDANGDPTQHLQYLPFGENYIEQRATTDYYTPYTFSAKERDSETGYSYFGARYYDPNVSVWLSVDPMADKYPSMSSYMYVGGHPTMITDPDGRDWYVNNETGAYQWFKGSDNQEGYKNVGAYKVIFNSDKNRIDVYYQDNKDIYESISMDKKKDGSYKNDRAAKFAMIAAESGGSNAKNADPVYDALIISASMDNRLSVELSSGKNPFSTAASRKKHGGNTYQSIFIEGQYDAAGDKSYSDFSYGHKKRYGSNIKLANIGLAATYNAMDFPVLKLMSRYKMGQAYQILAYGHGKSCPTLHNDFKIAFDKKLAPSMNCVKGSSTWRP